MPLVADGFVILVLHQSHTETLGVAPPQSEFTFFTTALLSLRVSPTTRVFVCMFTRDWGVAGWKLKSHTVMRNHSLDSAPHSSPVAAWEIITDCTLINYRKLYWCSVKDQKFHASLGVVMWGTENMERNLGESVRTRYAVGLKSAKETGAN